MEVLRFVANRFAYMLIMMVLVSIVSFLVIQLPPGDYVTQYVIDVEAAGGTVADEVAAELRRQYGLDQSVVVQYLRWIGRLSRGQWGYSFAFGQPVRQVIGERIGMTVVISLLTLMFTYSVAIPIGVYSATHQNSLGDRFVTAFGMLGLATPNFLLALVLIFFSTRWFGTTAAGLFSSDYIGEPWSWGKLWDLIRHLPVPVIVVGTAGTAGIIRVMRGQILDELGQRYVTAARARGVEERRILRRYPVRMAINPILSTVGWLLPSIVSGTTITAMVLSLPTVGPALFRALLGQDLFLAASIVMILSFLTLVGTFLSDVLLAIVDPRMRSATSGGDYVTT